MSITNVSGSDLVGVPWRITSDDGQASKGTVNIPACNFVIVSLLWKTLPGTHTFTGDVDPLNTLHESESGFSNNRRIFVAPIFSQELDYVRAVAAGAQSVNDNSRRGTCARLGVEDAQGSSDYGVGQMGAIFVADCASLTSAFGQPVRTGARADPEAYKNFRLMNGWRVKQVIMQFTTTNDHGASLHDSLQDAQSQIEKRHQSQGFGEIITPSPGSNDPHVKVHISVRPGSFLGVYVKIYIEGIEGTDPYGAETPNPCASGFVPIVTPSGMGCAEATDVATCSGDPCALNVDCPRGNVCSTSPCSGVCVRGHVP